MTLSLTSLVEYMKLHLLSLEQDSEKHQAYMDTITEYDSDEWESAEIEDISLNGQWIATNHLLSVALDRLNDITPQGDR